MKNIVWPQIRKAQHNRLRIFAKLAFSTDAIYTDETV